ncbi:hypothetical protein DF3PA_20167 [Candidatus Defluviicoccus seviourii]|uniref:Uncharacterized protein n=1 Tax=Candidatus Defluviicoccus seviourii TaxID=2565273 RepID=A0A564WCN4_9PROT|nr:hypothetical protein DF3PA_20167 [Candidatus Defluviicoccus seviourii]
MQASGREVLDRGQADPSRTFPTTGSVGISTRKNWERYRIRNLSTSVRVAQVRSEELAAESRFALLTDQEKDKQCGLRIIFLRFLVKDGARPLEPLLMRFLAKTGEK